LLPVPYFFIARLTPSSISRTRSLGCSLSITAHTSHNRPQRISNARATKAVTMLTGTIPITENVFLAEDNSSKCLPKDVNQRVITGRTTKGIPINVSILPPYCRRAFLIENSSSNSATNVPSYRPFITSNPPITKLMRDKEINHFMTMDLHLVCLTTQVQARWGFAEKRPTIKTPPQPRKHY
jgi:hypothetical protein